LTTTVQIKLLAKSRYGLKSFAGANIRDTHRKSTTFAATLNSTSAQPKQQEFKRRDASTEPVDWNQNQLSKSR